MFLITVIDLVKFHKAYTFAMNVNENENGFPLVFIILKVF